MGDPNLRRGLFSRKVHPEATQWRRWTGGWVGRKGEGGRCDLCDRRVHIPLVGVKIRGAPLRGLSGPGRDVARETRHGASLRGPLGPA